MNVLISACLLGVSCRYDGQSKPCHWPGAPEGIHWIPVCPEIYGGLPTPRVPAERLGDAVRTADGRDVTAAYRRGAAETLRLATLFGCRAAVLKARSPSCGRGSIYDGTFTGRLTTGDGVTAALLAQHGIRIFDETEWDALSAWARKETEA